MHTRDDTTIETTNEEHIRQRAYMLWLAEGQPDGRAEEHWHMAQAQAAKSLETAQAPKTRKKKVQDAAR